MNARDPRVPWTYSQEAKKRIAGLGSKEIAEFLSEIPLSDRKVAYRCIKSVAGFRPDSESAFREKGRRFVAALTQTSDQGSNAHIAEWGAFSYAWLSWGSQRFQSQFPGPPDEPIADEREAVESFIKQLVPEQNLTVCREDVERLLLFSGFALRDETPLDLARIPSRSTLAQARKAAMLPAEVEYLKEQLKSREAEIAVLRNTTDAIRTEAEDLKSQLAESLSQISSFRDELSNFELAQKNAQIQNGELSQTLEHDVRELESRLTAMTEKVQARFANIDEEADHLTSVIAENQETVARLVNVITSVQERVDTPSPPQIVRAPEPMAASLIGAPDVQLTPHSIASKQMELTVTAINDAETALNAISTNLSVIGLRKDDAVLVAASVLTGVVAGQLVQFRGAFAELLVEAVAAALSDSPMLSWRVPIGLRDSGDASFVLSRISSAGESAGCIAIFGANKSAFEVYGDRVTTVVAKMQLGLDAQTPNVPLMATFVGGSGVLPAGPEFCCLGPHIDSDALNWVKANRRTTAMIGRLTLGSWTELVEPAKINEDIDQVIRALPVFSLSTKLWERTARNAMLILSALEMPGSMRPSTNFLKHWLLPWARANGIKNELLYERLIKTEGGWFDWDEVQRMLVEARDVIQ